MTAVTSQRAITDFRESEIGKLFQAYESALATAWIADQQEHVSDRKLTKVWAKADAARHAAGEYVRGDVHTNTIEGYFSIFKRGMKGVYQHCAKKHLHRYVAEFEFRYNNRIAHGVDDSSRTVKAILGTKGKRLTYQQSNR